jgi:uncharacterized protein
LDSWPVLEWIKGRQPASERFMDLIVQSANRDITFAMSRINYGEVIYSIRKAPEILNRDAALEFFYCLLIEVHSAEDALVDAAVELKSRYSFSYADAFAAALAIKLNSPVVTGDQEFRVLEADGVLKLHWLGA